MSGDDDKLLAQDDIEKLLAQTGKSAGKSPPAAARLQLVRPPADDAAADGAAADEEAISRGDVEYLLNQAQEAIKSVSQGDLEPDPHGAAHFKLEKLSGTPASTEAATLDLIRDVDLDLRIELGRTHMYLEDVLKLRKGSVVPLDKLAGDPVDIFVNGRLIARGEVLVLNDNFCVRIAELISGAAAG